MKRQRRARYNVQRSLSRGGFFEWLLSTFPKGLGKAESDLSRNKPKGRCISFLFFFFFCFHATAAVAVTSASYAQASLVRLSCALLFLFLELPDGCVSPLFFFFW